jgi:hypothetical protein
MILGFYGLSLRLLSGMAVASVESLCPNSVADAGTPSYPNAGWRIVANGLPGPAENPAMP